MFVDRRGFVGKIDLAADARRVDELAVADVDADVREGATQGVEEHQGTGLQLVALDLDQAGRGGNNHLLLSLLQNGSLESEIRSEFMKVCNADNAEARKKAYQRAKAALIQGGLMDVAEGYVVVLYKENG